MPSRPDPAADPGVVARGLPPRRPTTTRVVVAVVVMTVVMLLTAWVGTRVVVVTEAIRAADVRAVDAATAWTLGADAERPLLLWAELTMPWVLYLLLGTMAAVLYATGRVRRRAVWVIPIALVAWGLGVICKLIVARPRPTPDEAITHVGSYSYPSGHALNSTIAMILLVWLLWPVLARGWARALLVLVALTLVVLTCLDRVYLGVHYPSDVLTGVLTGALMTAAGIVGVSETGPPLPDDRDQSRASRARTKQ